MAVAHGNRMREIGPRMPAGRVPRTNCVPNFVAGDVIPDRMEKIMCSVFAKNSYIDREDIRAAQFADFLTFQDSVTNEKLNMGGIRAECPKADVGPIFS